MLQVFSIRFAITATAAAALAFGFASPLAAQTSAYLNYVDHIDVDFEHSTMLSTNIATYFRDIRGDLQAPSAGALSSPALFYLFSSRELHFLSYNRNGATAAFLTADLTGELPTLGSGSEVSYTRGSTTFVGPNISDNYTLNDAFITGGRSSLHIYNILAQDRKNTVILKTVAPEPSFTPGNALLATGERSTYLTSNGRIYFQDPSTADFETTLTPFITAQGSGPGELSNPTALSVGSDGLLYVLDAGNNRIQTFDLETGAHRGGFSFPEGLTTYSTSVTLDENGDLQYLGDGTRIFTTSMAISTEGRIYLGDGVGGGFIFDLEGHLLENFHPPAADPGWVDGGLAPGPLGVAVGVGSFLEYDGVGNIFTYVEGKGLFMYRDPFYDTLDYVNLTIDASVTSGPGKSIVNSLSFGNPTYGTPGTLTIVDPVTVGTGNLYVANGITGTIEGGTIVTDGAVHKINAGTLILDNINTYTGQTIIDDGKLIVNGALTGGVQVTDHATLGGHGLIGGSVTVDADGILSPGDGLGLLTIKGDLTMADFSTLLLEFGGTSAGLFDQLAVLGLFTAHGTLSLQLVDGYTPRYGDSFQVFIQGGYQSGFTNIDTNLGNGLAWDPSQLATTGFITVVPEPETTAAAIACLLGAMVLLRRRPAFSAGPNENQCP